MDKFILKSGEDFSKEVTRKMQTDKIGKILGRNAKRYRIVCQLGNPRIFKKDTELLDIQPIVISTLNGTI